MKKIEEVIGTKLSSKNLLSISDFSKEQIYSVFDLTKKMKDGTISADDQREFLKGKTLAMIFEKPSLRTRVSFETGIFQLGGQAINLQPSDIALGKRESIYDAAKNFERMVDIIMARVYEHSTVADLAEHAKIPVINGLSDLEHPCQAMADFMTILEHKGKLEGLKVSFIGDGNNVAHSLMLFAGKVGCNFTIGCPFGYEPAEEIFDQAQSYAKETGAEIILYNDPMDAVKDADVVYTDVWASMGQEAEAEAREEVFAPFQVNTDLMSNAKSDTIFMHCLPAHRGLEVTDEVIDSKQSVVFDEAENRLHVQKAIMVMLSYL
ncbi:MAG: ornithine carbamoyltransferase [Armatimonadota bacterium]